MFDGTMVELKSKVFCPNGGVFTDAAGCLVSGSKAATVGLGMAAIIGALV